MSFSKQLRLKMRLVLVIFSFFHRNNRFCLLQILKRRLNSDLESIINSNPDIPEFLSLFIHGRLKQNDYDRPSQDDDLIVDKATMLLDYLREKDTFEQCYQRHLAQRLFSNKPISNDTENNMVLRLKTRFATQFTYQLEGMLKDILISNTIMNDFRRSTAQKPPNLPSIDLSVRILKTSLWSIPSVGNHCNLPQIVNDIYRSFQTFYLSIHTGRRLTLHAGLGTADLMAVFYGGAQHEDLHGTKSQSTTENIIRERQHRLQVSTHQMIILMLFNTRDFAHSRSVHRVISFILSSTAGAKATNESFSKIS